VDLLELEQGVDPAQHWYYRTKADGLRRALRVAGIRPSTITDVGAGSGFFSTELLKDFPSATARCVDPNYSDEQLADSTPQLTFTREDYAPADLYLFMDVLEHVEDDRALLSGYMDKAEPGAHVFISVPAMQFLWSGHDVFLGHYRRYTLKQIEQVARDAGLRLLSGRYLYGATFPVVSAVRLATRKDDEPKSDMKPVHPRVNTVLSKVLAAENRLPGNRLAGSTALVLAVRD
jgi:hypothetical protein